MESNGMVPGVNMNDFTPGTVVKGVKDNDITFQGEVIAFNRDLGWLVIQPQAKPTEKQDIFVLSMSSIKEIDVVKEASSADPLPKLCVNKMRQRRLRNLQKMSEDINRLGDGVTEEAQKLYNHINKTLRDIAWEGHDIVVMRAVVIAPPYCSARLRDANSGAYRQLLSHVNKVMEQFRLAECAVVPSPVATAAAAPTAVSPPVSSSYAPAVAAAASSTNAYSAVTKVVPPYSAPGAGKISSARTTGRS